MTMRTFLLLLLTYTCITNSFASGYNAIISRAWQCSVRVSTMDESSALDDQQRQVGLEADKIYVGTGFAISSPWRLSDPLIMTAYHVVDGARNVVIELIDGVKVRAEVILVDKKYDLALLQADDFVAHKNCQKYVKFSMADLPLVGDLTFAIGNQFGRGNVLTSGVISATPKLARHGEFVQFVQTDAAVNYGSSGGPLLDERGDAIGVLNTTFAPKYGNIGLSYAVSVSAIKSALKRMLLMNSIESRFGLELYPYAGQGKSGVEVKNSSVQGIDDGDIITMVSGHRVSNIGELRWYLFEVTTIAQSSNQAVSQPSGQSSGAMMRVVKSDKTLSDILVKPRPHI